MSADPWAIDASGGAPAYSAAEMRLLTTTPFLAGAGASLGVRSGVRPSGSGTDLLVQAQASPNMTVKVNTGVIVAQGAISVTQGAYTWALDALLASLTIAAAHATLARTDLVVVRIRDANVDTSGQRDGGVIVITGTAGGGVPTPPTDASYFTLAQVAVRSVSAGGGTIVAGDITDKRQFTTALGGVILCTSATEPAASTVMPGQPAYRSDITNAPQRYSDGSNWQTAPRILGGTRWTGGGNFVIGLTTTELVVMTAAAVNLPANSYIEISAGIRLLATVANDVYVFRIRETNVSGAQRAEFTWQAPNNGSGFNEYFKGQLETTAAVSTTFVVTAQRVAGTGSLTMIAGPSINYTHLIASVCAPSGAVTASAAP